MNQRRGKRHKNTRVKVPLRNVTGNKVTLFRQKSGRREKAPITEKKSVWRDNAVGLRIIRCRRRRRSANDVALCGWLVAANIKPFRLRVWRTTVIHNIVRPHYLRLASLRACLVVRRASPPFSPPEILVLISEVTRDEKERVGERFLIN